MTRESLEKLLSENEKIQDNKLYIWGTGNTTMLYQQGLARLKKEGFQIEGYIDNNEKKWGDSIGGVPIYSPESMQEKKDALILICSPQPSIIRSVSGQISNLGLKYRHIDEFILSKHKQEVLAVFDLLEDEQSREIYSELVNCRLKGKYPDKIVSNEEAYFSYKHFGDSNPNEVFVDCGAYVGDTIERYIWKKEGAFKKIIAFEPDRTNFKAIGCRLERLKNEWGLDKTKFQVYPYGISEATETAFVQRYEDNNGFGTKIVSEYFDNVDECKVVSLDDIIDEKIDFLKADIESFEYNMILGAKKIITKWKPKLAICIYHNAVDFYSIPLLLKNINSNYHFAIRHYTHTLSETVLYTYEK